MSHRQESVRPEQSLGLGVCVGVRVVGEIIPMRLQPVGDGELRAQNLAEAGVRCVSISGEGGVASYLPSSAVLVASSGSGAFDEDDRGVG